MSLQRARFPRGTERVGGGQAGKWLHRIGQLRGILQVATGTQGQHLGHTVRPRSAWT